MDVHTNLTVKVFIKLFVASVNVNRLNSHFKRATTEAVFFFAISSVPQTVSDTFEVPSKYLLNIYSENKWINQVGNKHTKQPGNSYYFCRERLSVILV